MVILGVNSAYHETAAALIVDGRLVSAVEEERFNRVRHGKIASVTGPADLPWSAIRYCLSVAGLQPSDVDHIAYSFDPWKRRSHIWPPDGGASPVLGDFGTDEGEETFFQSHLLARERLQGTMARAQFCFVDHHLCHAASACFIAPFQDSAFLIADGIGEFESTTFGYCEGQRLKTIGRIKYPHSLGFLWEKVSEYLGFSRYDGPGQVMALGTAAYGHASPEASNCLDAFRQFVRWGPLDFTIDNEVLDCRGANFRGLEELFGNVADVQASLMKKAVIAAALQQITEEVLCSLANGLHAEIVRCAPNCSENLALAGGVVLNCAANSEICKRSPWSKTWIPPAPNDAGTALGAALWVWHEALGKNEKVPFADSYLGPAFGDLDYQRALNSYNLLAWSPQDLMPRVADLIASGKVVAWFQGRCEFGPRALGNRSILANPSSSGSKELLNRKIKQREPFRPFAPSVLQEAVSGLFDIIESERYLLDYMQSTPVAKSSATIAMPATLHMNAASGRSTARVHSVRSETTPRFAELLQHYEKLTGVAALLNTSFNIQEPIVCSPEDACKTFSESGIDYLVLGSLLVGRG